MMDYHSLAAISQAAFKAGGEKHGSREVDALPCIEPEGVSGRTP